MAGETWGCDLLLFVEPEWEHSAASVCRGICRLAGGRVTNFTSGQGLVLMKEVLYTISRQAITGGHPHRGPGADQPFAQRPCRPR